jgi:hypothetical protein
MSSCGSHANSEIGGLILSHERRLAVGTPNGRRSTVWKFTANKGDIYIHTRMFGSDTKVSLHATGDCQWSCTDHWVQKVHGRKNAQRHMVRWHLARPHGAVAQHVFRVRIPESELRTVAVEEKLAKVQWLPALEGQTVSFECYITPRSDADPSLGALLPNPRQFSLPLSDGRWFVVLTQVLPLNGEQLERVRGAIKARAQASGYVPEPLHRACAFTVADDDDARGLIELCLV